MFLEIIKLYQCSNFVDFLNSVVLITSLILEPLDDSFRLSKSCRFSGPITSK